MVFQYFSTEILKKKENLLNFYKKKKIETRPIITGNFVNQPAIKLFKLNKENKNFPNANEIEKRSFFIGLHAKPIDNKTLNYLIQNLKKFDEI